MSDMSAIELEARESLLGNLMQALSAQGVRVVAAFGNHTPPYLEIVAYPSRGVGELGGFISRNFPGQFVLEVTGTFGGFPDHPAEVDLRIMVKEVS